MGGDVYPLPVMKGEWKLLRAFLDPKAEHTYQIRYKVGQSVTSEDEVGFSWKVSCLKEAQQK